MDKGYIQIYMGHGKGKTTCSLGLALRSIGAGFNVMMVQFLKNKFTSELESIKILDKFHIYRAESKKSFTYNLDKDKLNLLNNEVKEEFEKAKEFINSGKYNIIILDEILGAIQGGFIEEEDLISVMKSKPKNLELILTGRNASENIIKHADLVSRIDEVKHYYKDGVLARIGIEY